MVVTRTREARRRLIVELGAELAIDGDRARRFLGVVDSDPDVLRNVEVMAGLVTRRRAGIYLAELERAVSAGDELDSERLEHAKELAFDWDFEDPPDDFFTPLNAAIELAGLEPADEARLLELADLTDLFIVADFFDRPWAAHTLRALSARLDLAGALAFADVHNQINQTIHQAHRAWLATTIRDLQPLVE